MLFSLVYSIISVCIFQGKNIGSQSFSRYKMWHPDQLLFTMTAADVVDLGQMFLASWERVKLVLNLEKCGWKQKRLLKSQLFRLLFDGY